MRYTGRLIGLAFILINALLWNLYQWHLYHSIHFDVFTLLAVFGDIVLCWWLGKQYDLAKYYSQTDPLTEMYNRRFIVQTFPKLISAAERKNESLFVFVVDIDDFKGINDTYGHEMGDKVLQHVSNTLIRSTRKTDIIARWGGDEFLIIIPSSDRKASESLLRRINGELKNSSQEVGIDVSISIGSSQYPEDANNLDEMIKKADYNMYQFKFKNKNSLT